MSRRVAVLATLLGFLFVLTVLLFSAHNLALEENEERTALLLKLSRISAVAVRAPEGGSAVINSILEDPDLELSWYDADLNEISGHIEQLLPVDHLKRDLEHVPVEDARVYRHDDASGHPALHAIYRFEEGGCLLITEAAHTTASIFFERRWTYITLLVGVSLLVFAVAKFMDYRRQRLINDIMDTLEAFSEGKFDTRVSHFKGDSPKKIAEYNAVLSRIEERIFRQRSRNQALSVVMNQMQNGILAVNERLEVMLVTPVAKQLLGITGSVEGAPLEGVSKDVNLVPIFTEAMQQEGVYTNEVAARTAVGRGHRPLRLYVSPMRQDGQVVGALAMVEDITELRRLEQVRTDFAANVSHELKTPLTSIKGFVETLLDGALYQPEMAEKFLKIIMLEADRLTRLINDILSITKLESGSDPVETKALRLDKMAYDVAEMLRIHAAEKEVTINARMNPEPVYVIGNADRVEQMLINLVENAIKYNKQGGSVTVQVFANEREASLTVSDTGIGIPEEHLPRLFERFYRVDKGRSRSMGGTGLGLAIVKHIIRSMGGEIEVQSKFGEGTEFLVTLPLAPKDEIPDEEGEDFDDEV